MSRIVTACVLVLIVVAGCVTGELVVHNCNDRISQAIDEAYQLAEQGNFDSAKTAAESAESEFIRCEGALAIFINHTLVEDLGEQIAKLPTLATEETVDEFLSESASASVMLTHIVRDNHPTILNIL